MAIPDSVTQLSAGWLSEALQTPIASVSTLDQHDGTTGRAALALQREDGTSQRIFAKLPPADEQQRMFVVATGMGEREARFYAELAAEVPVRVPASYYSEWAPGGEHYIMLLEDLEASGFGFRTASEHYSLAYVESVLDAFARLHSQYWETPRFATDLDWISAPPQHPIAPVLVAQAHEAFADQMPPVFSELAQLYTEHTDAIHRLWERGPHTLVHGDAHDGNMFADGDSPGFLDWALLAKTNPMRDVGYFLAGTVEPNDLKASAGTLLARYREALIREGVTPPDAAQMYCDCQLHAAYVWVGAVTTLAMGDAWQPQNYVLKTLERLHQSLEFLETAKTIESELADL
ncbi:hypothetical protein A3709_00060 [Halioglobus sp. HI00S01]|uniref:phosphotransferase n=1 Tax=Halioglobus sp. HI00S01 TaxID=1822214 RepID=UPI0007C289FF|nr:phosphotransferase [Halioglobus sp. HI00S01]KZX60508.1 hypothetical protein A3709_00060 [Halioglobus sp. HI00S01]